MTRNKIIQFVKDTFFKAGHKKHTEDITIKHRESCLYLADVIYKYNSMLPNEHPYDKLADALICEKEKSIEMKFLVPRDGGHPIIVLNSADFPIPAKFSLLLAYTLTKLTELDFWNDIIEHQLERQKTFR